MIYDASLNVRLTYNDNKPFSLNLFYELDIDWCLSSTMLDVFSPPY